MEKSNQIKIEKEDNKKMIEILDKRIKQMRQKQKK